MRFLADAMLGTLAKWLRLIGYDTVLAQREPDAVLVLRARAEGRVLLTRDAEIARRRDVDTLLIETEVLGGQLKQVVEAFNLAIRELGSICPTCNEALEELPYTEARPLVPVYVYCTQKHFRRCPVCERVYWQGTHYQRMEARLRELLSDSHFEPSGLE